jgi:hypothetical protein
LAEVNIHDGNIYKLTGELVKALIHENDSLSVFWRRRLEHLHYKALSVLRNMVTGLPKFGAEQQGLCKGCALGKNAKVVF